MLFILCILGTVTFAQNGSQSPANTPLDYTTSWAGNTFSGGNFGPNMIMKHVQNDIESIYVTPDGLVYTNTGWDEGGRSLTTFKNGQIVNPLNVVNDKQRRRGQRGRNWNCRG